MTPETLKIADNATLILPLHRDLDGMREDSNTAIRIGTTRRGIGPAYEDKVGRRAIRLCDLADPATLAAKVDTLLLHHNALRSGMGRDPVDRGELIRALTEVAPKVLPYAEAVWRRLDDLRRAGKRILFEGAQAAMLDVDHGTYPFVTSSNTVAAQACIGSGHRPRRRRLCARHHQGLHHAGRARAVSDRAQRRDRPAVSASAATSSAPSPAGRGAAAGSTP